MSRGSALRRRFLALLIVLSVLSAGLAGCGGKSARPEKTETKEEVAVPAKLWVEPSEANGLPARIDVFRAGNGDGTEEPGEIFELYLPGNADPTECYLSWNGAMKAVVDGRTYDSGACPIPSPAPGNLNTVAETITFSDGGRPANTLSVVTYQGSEGVKPVFIEIDESLVTIAAMDGDEKHETSCSGKISIGGEWYTLSAIKGRGNVTWRQAQDKRPYNVTLEDKIKFPGIDSPKTKKWSFLSENSDHSLLCNRAGFFLACEIGVGQDTASADVWMNGEYQGCYTVTPKSDSFVSDEGYMIEQDNYLEPSGGDPQFTLKGLVEPLGRPSGYNRITVKKIGSSVLADSGQEEAVLEMKDWLQDALDAILSEDGYNAKGRYYTDYIDLESFARMYLVQEYVKNYDICAGSLFFHRDGLEEEDRLIAGPLWDLDNALGSTNQNTALGSADDRERGDRRSGAGDFIPKVSEYKTVIFKNLGKHDDFMEEVAHQYELCRSAFEGLPDATQDLIDEIAASARMNHKKVIDLTIRDRKSVADIRNNHFYSAEISLGSGEYVQRYLPTTDSRNDWDNYAANLKTYITTRSKWFRRYSL